VEPQGQEFDSAILPPNTMKTILIVLFLTGCVIHVPVYFKDDSGKCHAVTPEGVMFDVDCDFIPKRR
jgi:hypothetical protein